MIISEKISEVCFFAVIKTRPKINVVCYTKGAGGKGKALQDYLLINSSLCFA